MTLALEVDADRHEQAPKLDVPTHALLETVLTQLALLNLTALYGFR